MADLGWDEDAFLYRAEVAAYGPWWYFQHHKNNCAETGHVGIGCEVPDGV